jgi:hypothetical protein
MDGDPDAERTFRFDFEDRYRRPAKLFGIDDDSAFVRLTRQQLIARFGPWLLVTPLVNIVKADITGPYSFLKTAGPAHLSLSDRGLTFATNSRKGVCLSFSTSVAGMDPFGLVRHPNLTVTVADCARLISMLGSSSSV